MSAGRRIGCWGKRLVGSSKTLNLGLTRPDKGASVDRSVYMVFQMALLSSILEYLHKKVVAKLVAFAGAILAKGRSRGVKYRDAEFALQKYGIKFIVQAVVIKALGQRMHRNTYERGQ
jgi:hypothetical protein